MKKEKKIEKKQEKQTVTKLIFTKNDKKLEIILSDDMTKHEFSLKDNFKFFADEVSIFAKYSFSRNLFSSNSYAFELNKIHLINLNEIEFKHKTEKKIHFIYIYLSNSKFSKKNNKYKLLHNYKLHIDSMQFIDSKW